MKLLFVTHQLSRTGAPVVLLDMIKLFLSDGHDITVISQLPGELSDELDELNIPVSIKDDFWRDRGNFTRFASDFDRVIANTLVTYQVVLALYGAKTSVVWWLHEGVQYFEYFKSVLPDFSRLPDNLKVYCVSSYVADVVEAGWGVKLPILPFAVSGVDAQGSRDEARDSENGAGSSDPWKDIFGERKTVRFMTCGTYSKVKAQDVLVQAIEALPSELKDKCSFLFVGNESMTDPEVFGPVEKLCNTEPESVKKLPAVARTEVLRLMKQADYMIIPSRIEPVSAVAIEAMMQGTPSVITDVCGVSRNITDHVSGLLVGADDPTALSAAIREAVSIREDEASYRRLSDNAREVYEKNYTWEVIAPQMRAVLKI